MSEDMEFLVGDVVRIVDDAGWAGVVATVIAVSEEGPELRPIPGSRYAHTGEEIPEHYLKTAGIWTKSRVELINRKGCNTKTYAAIKKVTKAQAEAAIIEAFSWGKYSPSISCAVKALEHFGLIREPSPLDVFEEANGPVEDRELAEKLIAFGKEFQP